jgi:hypothetical protein
VVVGVQNPFPQIQGDRSHEASLPPPAPMAIVLFNML